MRTMLHKVLAFAVATALVVPTLSAGVPTLEPTKAGRGTLTLEHATAAPKGLTRTHVKTKTRAERAFTAARPISAQQTRRSAAPAQVLRAQAGSTPILGSVIYSDAWTEDDQNPGIYTLPVASAPTSLEAVALHDDLAASSGGTLVGDIYISCNYISFFGNIFCYANIFDATTWEELGYMSIPVTLLATDIAYDQVSGKVYGCFYDENAENFELGAFDPEALLEGDTSRSTICSLEAPLNAIAAGPDGTIYGIDFLGNLSSFDKTTGEATLIGSTGVEPYYTASATIDQMTGTMYWTVCPEDENGYLYIVDTQLGDATLLYQLPNNEEVTGLAVPAPAASEGAPAPVTDLTAAFENGSLTGKVSFDTPTTTFDGADATGALTYTVSIEGETIATGATEYGSHVEVDVTVDAAGFYKFDVVVANAAGTSPKTSVKVYVGDDVPEAVTGLTATWADGTFTVTWNAVTEGINGGYINASEVTYTVTRIVNNEATIVAEGQHETSFTEAFAEPESITKVVYTVQAQYKDVASETVAATPVILGAITLPFTATFDDASDLALFTVVDANGDGKTWNFYNENVYCTYNSSMSMDDWLITPPFKVEKGKIYDISFSARGNSSYYLERVEACIGTSTDPATMTTVVVEPTEVSNTEVILTGSYVAKENGTVCLGIHGISDADMFYLFVDDIQIAAGYSGSAPAAPQITVESDPEGLTKATVTVVAPTETANGAVLMTLKSVDIFRDGEAIASISPVTPGRTVSYVDETPAEGYHTYSAVAVNNAGAGVAADATVYVGINVPATPTNVVVAETANIGEVTITWDAPEYDIDGHVLNPTFVTYTVLDMEGMVVAENLTECTITTRACDADAEQTFVYYGVIAATKAGESGVAVSNIEPVGKHYVAPMVESFANGKISYIWGQEDAVNGASVKLLTTEAIGLEAQDGDGGMAGIYGNSLYAAATLVSGKVDLSTCNDPHLVFYTYVLAEDDDNTLEVFVNDGTGFTKVLNRVQSTGTVDTWERIDISLAAYKNKSVQVGFRGTVLAYTYIIIDNITIGDLLDNDLKAVAVEAPAKVQAGEDFQVSVKVANLGALTAEGYTVDLLRDGEVVATAAGEAIESGASALVTFSEVLSVLSADVVEYSAKVNFAADENAANNACDATAVHVIKPKFPTVNDLAAETDENGAVTLTWTAPVIGQAVIGLIEDDVEDYEAFAQEVEGWTIVDADGCLAGGVNGVNFPGCVAGQDTLGFLVMNPAAVGIDPTVSTAYAPHSGDQFFAAIFNYQGEANDDWLISPELPGMAQTISFWAKSFNASYKESFQILYSTSGTDTADFTLIQQYRNIDADWTEYTAELPEGTTHFAIRYISQDCFMFFVDDITFTASSNDDGGVTAIEGFNLYRDGAKLNETLLANPTYVDNEANDGRHSYQVTVVYDLGESAASNEVVVDVETGVANVALGAKVSVIGHSIVIAGADAAQIFAADGKQIFGSARMEGKRTAVNVTPGVYVVTTGDKATKVVVR